MLHPMNDALTPEAAARRLLLGFHAQGAGVAHGLDYTAVRQSFLANHGNPKEFIAGLKYSIDRGWLKFDHGGFTLALTAEGLQVAQS